MKSAMANFISIRQRGPSVKAESFPHALPQTMFIAPWKKKVRRRAKILIKMVIHLHFILEF